VITGSLFQGEPDIGTRSKAQGPRFKVSILTP
jgi:hypothetical protein